jgi:hypothetical protein
MGYHHTRVPGGELSGRLALTTVSMSRHRVIRGGASLIAATILFALVFSYLAATFDYPDVLDRQAGEVLPALLALGTTGRAIWVSYGLMPLLLLPTALGVNDAVKLTTPRLGRAAVWLAALSAVAMMTGLLRWSTLQWNLAESWATASPESRSAMASTFATANFYLGNVIGEFLGELFLNAFFLVAAVSLAKAASRQWLAVAGIGAAALGWAAMLRNITPRVSAVAEVNNVVLPLWMLTLGIALLTTRRKA